MTAGRVLVVDDDPALLQALPQVVYLRLRDVVVETCDAAPAALGRLEAVDYDAVVSDIKMPGMDGLALLERARAIRPDLPVLLITGHGERDLAVQALRGGAYDFIQKPIDRDYFVAAIARAVATRHLRREVARQKQALERHSAELEAAVEARTRKLTEANHAKDELLIREQAVRREAEAAKQHFAFFAEAGPQLAASLDFDTVLRTLARLAVRHLADWCVVDLLEEDRRIRRVAVAHADPEREVVAQRLSSHPPEARGSHPVAVVLRTGEPQLASEVTDACLLRITDDPAHRDLLRALGLASYVCIPLAARGRTFGALWLASNDRHRRYGHGDLALAEELARRGALAAENARLYHEAQAAIQARDAFLARASHELRTPLTSAFATIHLLVKARERGRQEPAESLLGVAYRSLEAMRVLVNDLLDASKLASGREALALERLELGEVVGASLAVVDGLARDKDVTLRATVPAGIHLVADRFRLEQVLLNLAANAVQFTPARGEVIVEAERSSEAVVIRVRDSGEGIPPEQLEAIFEPFVQVRRSRGRQRPVGTGLGLAICRQIVALHGGRIWAESEGPGRGSTFTVSLPAVVERGRAA